MDEEKKNCNRTMPIGDDEGDNECSGCLRLLTRFINGSFLRKRAFQAARHSF